MKVLFDHALPFSFAHGGEQLQIEKTREILIKLGIEVEYLRWWDDVQAGDLIHYFGRPSELYVRLAHQKGIKVITAELLSGPAARSAWVIQVQKYIIRIARKYLPVFCTERMAWNAYLLADRCISLTEHEASLVAELFSVESEKIVVIPNGVEEDFFSSECGERNQRLICTASIVPRKRVVELAEAAVVAKVPVWIIGKPFSEADTYYLKLKKISSTYPEWVRYEGAIDDRKQLAKIYKKARGFVLLSTQETLSLSTLEAAAAKCPLLLSEMPWATKTFGDSAMYCPIAGKDKTVQVLSEFYKKTPLIRPTFVPMTWESIGKKLVNVYKEIINNKNFTEI